MALTEPTPWVKCSVLSRCCKSTNLTKRDRLLCILGKTELEQIQLPISAKKASESCGKTPGSIRRLNLTTVLTLLLHFFAFKVLKRGNNSRGVGGKSPVRGVWLSPGSPLTAARSHSLFTVTPTGLPTAPASHLSSHQKCWWKTKAKAPQELTWGAGARRAPRSSSSLCCRGCRDSARGSSQSRTP